MELCSVERRPDGRRRVGTFLRIDGQDGSEVTGPAFNAAGDRLYVSSQRGPDGRGITYEITGEFHRAGIDGAASGWLAPANRRGVVGP